MLGLALQCLLEAHPGVGKGDRGIDTARDSAALLLDETAQAQQRVGIDIAP